MTKNVRMLAVKNWHEYQHYKTRNPPWIKLHWALLASDDWVMLSDGDRLLLLICLMVASKFDGFVPDNPTYIKRVAYLRRTPNLKPLIDCGFLIIPQADASTLQADARPEKRREETEKRREDPRTSARDVAAEDSKPITPTGSSTEDRYWALKEKAAAAKIGQGMMGKLIKFAIDPEEALSILEDSLTAREPHKYLGKIVANREREQKAASAAMNGAPSDEPEIIREARREGALVERLQNKETGAAEWKAYGRIYNQQGQEIGW